MAIAVDQKTSVIGSEGISFGRKPSIERWLNVVVVVCIIGLFIAVGFAGWFYYKVHYVIQPKVETIRGHIEALGAQEKVAQAQQFSVAQSQLKALRTILENHIYASNVFTFIESTTHPRVRFSNVSVDTLTQQLSLSGQAASLTVLAEQLRIFERNADIVEFNMKGFNLNQAGTVDFSIDVTFNKSILRK